MFLLVGNPSAQPTWLAERDDEKEVVVHRLRTGRGRGDGVLHVHGRAEALDGLGRYLLELRAHTKIYYF